MAGNTSNLPILPYDWMDRPRFLKEYKLQLEYEFSNDGHEPEWAHKGHRFWGDEDTSIELEKDDPDKSEAYPSAAAALSPDGRVLAVSTNAVIRLYDIKSRSIIGELKAHNENVERMYFASKPNATNYRGGKGIGYYVLVSSGTRNYFEPRTIIWHLIASDLHAGRQTKGLVEPPILHAKVPSFGFVNPISPDGTKLITLEHNQSTQQGLRPPDQMPRIVVRNLNDLSEGWRLTGHQDLITWAGWSPDSTHVAEASWDQTYGIWNTKAKDRADGHLIGPTGNQNWVGDFSADGKYVVLSGGRPTKVAVYEVESGEEVAQLNHPHVQDDWVRKLRWSPIDYTLAVVVRQEVVLWHPLDGNAFTSVLKIETDGTLLTRYNDLTLVQWVDEGQKLVVRDTANTIYVWDIRMNKKWRFQRPDGLPCETNPQEVVFLKRLAKEGALLSLDGDGKVRYWYL